MRQQSGQRPRRDHGRRHHQSDVRASYSNFGAASTCSRRVVTPTLAGGITSDWNTGDTRDEGRERHLDGHAPRGRRRRPVPLARNPCATPAQVRRGHRRRTRDRARDGRGNGSPNRLLNTSFESPPEHPGRRARGSGRAPALSLRRRPPRVARCIRRRPPITGYAIYRCTSPGGEGASAAGDGAGRRRRVYDDTTAERRHDVLLPGRRDVERGGATGSNEAVGHAVDARRADRAGRHRDQSGTRWCSLAWPPARGRWLGAHRVHRSDAARPRGARRTISTLGPIGHRRIRRHDRGQRRPRTSTKSPGHRDRRGRDVWPSGCHAHRAPQRTTNLTRGGHRARRPDARGGRLGSGDGGATVERLPECCVDGIGRRGVSPQPTGGPRYLTAARCSDGRTASLTWSARTEHRIRDGTAGSAPRWPVRESPSGGDLAPRRTADPRTTFAGFTSVTGVPSDATAVVLNVTAIRAPDRPRLGAVERDVHGRRGARGRTSWGDSCVRIRATREATVTSTSSASAATIRSRATRERERSNLRAYGGGIRLRRRWPTRGWLPVGPRPTWGSSRRSAPERWGRSVLGHRTWGLPSPRSRRAVDSPDVRIFVTGGGPGSHSRTPPSGVA